MRPKPKRAGAIAGGLCIATTGVVAVPAATQAQNAGTRPSISVADRSLKHGGKAEVRGKAVGAHGRTIALEHRAQGAGGWSRLATAKVGRGDRYAVRARVPRSGRLRVTVLAQEGSLATASSAATSAQKKVTVARKVKIAGKKLHVKVGDKAKVRGRVAPRERDVPVKLQVRRGGSWKTLDRAETRKGGRYTLRDRVGSTGRDKVRVVAAYEDGLAKGRKNAGRLHGYRIAQASWYGPGFYGNRTGCGSTLGTRTLGVAHKTLPCGTKVSFKHGGRKVTVRVIDRGPYVGGREYDLTAATADRLGFRGHGGILSTK